MDLEAVVEFLGQVPLLQRLPSSSLRKIAEVVEVKHYEPGDHVVLEGQKGGSIYFILEGKAEVSGSIHVEEGNLPEYQLKQYDYFGNGAGDSFLEVNVVALSKLEAPMWVDCLWIWAYTTSDCTCQGHASPPSPCFGVLGTDFGTTMTISRMCDPEDSLSAAGRLFKVNEDLKKAFDSSLQVFSFGGVESLEWKPNLFFLLLLPRIPLSSPLCRITLPLLNLVLVTPWMAESGRLGESDPANPDSGRVGSVESADSNGVWPTLGRPE
ncbi:hypothetical protein Taro_016688 [Colocasia esculenta]|uniref:Cyclic nucleotide-binding domain-containing protein n=1 Tax=Colocasia esculenta TaxID=4460 RepID=A0A843ULD4_COLES|nr:hypothetical protein [Colocasia esculenta]